MVADSLLPTDLEIVADELKAADSDLPVLLSTVPERVSAADKALKNVRAAASVPDGEIEADSFLSVLLSILPTKLNEADTDLPVRLAILPEKLSEAVKNLTTSLKVVSKLEKFAVPASFFAVLFNKDPENDRVADSALAIVCKVVAAPEKLILAKRARMVFLVIEPVNEADPDRARNVSLSRVAEDVRVADNSFLTFLLIAPVKDKEAGNARRVRFVSVPVGVTVPESVAY